MTAARRPWTRRLFAVAGLHVDAHISVLLPIGVWDHGRLSAGGALGMLVVILLHAGGHLAAARAAGCSVRGLTLDAFGAWARRESGTSRAAARVCAFGGVLAQVGLLLVAFLAKPWLAAAHPQAWMLDLHDALVFGNLALLLVNLLPVGMTDLATALRLEGRHVASASATSRPRTAAPTAVPTAPPPIPADVAQRANTLMHELKADARARRQVVPHPRRPTGPPADVDDPS